VDIGVVGCGSAGGAAALFLARAGHKVTLYERVPEPGPVGAGIILQPTGMMVLDQLGLFPQVLARGAKIRRLACKNARGRTVVDLHYERVGRELFGLGLHRGVLFDVLYSAVKEEPNIQLRLGVEIRAIAESAEHVYFMDQENRRLGPHQLAVIADGAQSHLRAFSPAKKTVNKYPWGALWFVGTDEGGEFGEELEQIVDGPSCLFGLLPTGLGPARLENNKPLVSIFWSLRGDRLEDWRASGFEAWKLRLEKYQPRAKSLLEQIQAPEQMLYSNYYDVVLERHHHERTVYLGDAAHAMSPQLGQGCNLALFDAMTLADVFREQSDPRAALREYGRRRKPHLAYYQFATRWLTPVFQSDHHWLGFLRDIFMGLMCKIPVFEDMMLRSMAGVKRGIFRASLPVSVPPPQIRGP
jgi:2-polyprenyl-6-methoxyphenol hydroxylase-like FAD-dependent oxidoreductase